jgi:hypothetical protein
MKKSPSFAILLILALALAGGVTMAVINQNTINRLRTERDSLLAEKQDVERLATENKTIAQLRAQAAELEKIRAENKDLVGLRNEITQMRRQVGDLENLRSENKRLLEAKNAAAQSASRAPLAGFIARDSLRDVGLATPEATMQTFFAAIGRGDMRRAYQCNAVAPQEEVPQGAAAEAAARQMRDTFARFPGFAIVERTVISPVEIVIGIKSSASGSVIKTKLKLVGNEWKIDGDVK